MSFETLHREGMAALHRAEFDAAASLFRRASAAAENDAERALADMELVAIDILRNRPDVDLRIFRENVMRRHSPLHVMIASYYLTVSAVDRGDREGAARYLPVLLDAVKHLDDPVRTSTAYDAAAGVESIRGNHTAAIEYGRVAVQVLHGLATPEAHYLRTTATHNLAYNCLAASRYDEALLYADEAVALADAVGQEKFHAQPLVTAAFAYLCRERLDEALASIDRAEPLIAGTPLEKYMHYLRGEVFRRRGDRDEAARHFQRLEAFYPGIPTLTEMLLSMNLAPFLLPE